MQTKDHKNFVAAYKEPSSPIVDVNDWRELPSAPIAAPMPYASYTDRASGFTLATMPLAVATGFVVLLIGIAAFGVPLLSVAALLLALAGFSLVWLAAYIAHVFVSTDGALVLHTLSGWAYLKREQTERIERMKRMGKDS